MSQTSREQIEARASELDWSLVRTSPMVGPDSRHVGLVCELPDYCDKHQCRVVWYCQECHDGGAV